MKLICILGKKRSGKDTAVSLINEKYDTIDYKLAEPLKRTLYTVWKNSRLNPVLSWDDWDGRGFDREKALDITNEDVIALINDSVKLLHIKYNLNLDYYLSLPKDMILNNTESWNMRRLMQTLGTDIVVALDRMFWIKLFLNKYADEFDSGKDFFIVPDIRQVLEINILRAMGATIIHVVRPEIEETQKDNHITEAGLPIEPNDIVILNNGTLEKFKQKITKVLK